MARKIEQVQSELNSLPSGGSINIHNDTPQKQAARREARQKRRTLEQELVQLQGTGNYQTGTVLVLHKQQWKKHKDEQWKIGSKHLQK